MSTHIAPHRLRVVRGEPGFGRYRSIGDERVALYLLCYGAEVEIRPVEVGEFYLVHVPLAGRAGLLVDGERVSTPCDVVSPGHRLEIHRSHDSDMGVLRFPRAVLDAAVESRGVPRDGRGPVRFTPAITAGRPTSRAWLRTVRAYVDAARSGLLADSPLAAGHFEQLLLHGLLDSQPSSVSTALRAAARCPALPSALRRALAYGEEHAGEPVSIACMALAARVSVPALRAAFRAHLGTTPMAYLRRIRLERAHEDLVAVAEGRADGTVTDTALRWGFPHLGRFAEFYKETYGVSPSHTAGRRGYPEKTGIH
ncbi:AraC family transcriptional regulator [Streptomyces sp. NPDC091292]|uniref:AraC family transcriptional regulator n=1 Tax=Streptomyces sp. NPDC091292 TaxID=3365991 RepID=UPI0038169C6E